MLARRLVIPLLLVLSISGCDEREPEYDPGEPDEAASPAPSGTPGASLAREPFQETFVSAPTAFAAGVPASMRVVVSAVRGSRAVEPMANAEVIVTLHKDGRKVATVLDARTDAGGTLARSVVFPKVADGSYELEVRTKSKVGEETNRTSVTVGRRTRVLLVTDKPLYQPNQTIHLRALALHELDQTPAAGAEVELVVEDAKGNRVFKQKKNAGEFGEVFTDFRLADEVNEGEWRVRATIAGVEAEKVVGVKKYVLPKFKVALDAGKGFFQPGDTVKGKLRADYFFGKPVAGGEVTVVASTYDVAFHEFNRVTGKTDADGAFTFELELPKSFVGQPLQNGDALLKLDVTVKDKAEQEEKSTRTWPVAADGFRVTLVPESGKLVPGVENRIWAIATTPDGQALPRASVTLMLGDERFGGVKTDDAGIAAIPITPEKLDFTKKGAGAPAMNRHFGQPAGATERTLSVKLIATAPSGEKIERDEQIAAEGRGASILLRPDRAIYAGGATAAIEVLTAKHSGSVYLDVVKQGLTLATRVVDVKDGRGRYDLPLSADFSGTLELHAYVVPHDGNIVRDTKVIYVSPPSDLVVSARPDKKVYKAGEKALIRFEVSDKRGAGVPAAIAAVIVDESVYALQEIQPGLEKVYFTLEKELAEPKYEIHYSQENLAQMVKDPPRDARRQRAASILLAKAENVYSPAWTVNPALARSTKDRERLQMAWRYVRWHAQQSSWQSKQKPLGRKNDDGTWSWALDPLAGFEKSGWVTAEQTKDAWGRPITVALLEEAGYPASFDEMAALLTAQRLRQLYQLLYSYAANHPAEVSPGKKNFWEADVWKFPADVLSRIEKKGWVHAEMRKDLWGREMRYLESDEDLPQRQYVSYRQLKRSRIVSAGPDGIFGNRDDIDEPWLAEDEFWGGEIFAEVDMDFLADEVGGWGALGVRGRGVGGGAIGMRAGAARMEMPVPAMAPMAGADSLASVAKSGSPSLATTGAPRTEARIERVREYFPETLLWQPALITDAKGRASIELEMADSITTWRLSCSASSKAGALGSCDGSMKVFQDFFVDLDLPVGLTRGDEVSIPAAVYNYLDTAQDVRLVLQDAEWFERLSDAEQRLTIGPGEVDVRWFRIRAKQVGMKKLEVAAYGPKMSDAIRKEIEVVPDGKMTEVSKSDRLGGEVTWSFDVPEHAIPGASRAFVKLYPGMFSQVVEGVDGILRMPNGCMEQTGSSAYPNVLVMDYLKRSKQMKPGIQMTAEQYISLGYQRLLTFQTPDGGFALWGSHDKPIVFLTAWGLQILQDAAKVSDVDARVLERAKAYLQGRQLGDGSFPVEFAVHREIWGRMEGSFGITAYVAWALAEGGDRGPMTQKAIRYLEKNVGQVKDPYLLALAGAAFASYQREAEITRATLRRVDEAKIVDAKNRVVYWGNGSPTGVYATGKDAQIETTALAAYALHKGGGHSSTVNRALTFIVQSKDAGGIFGGTQATILALKALLAASDPGATGDSADVDVILNGDLVSSVKIRPENSDVLQMVDLRAGLKPGKNTVTVAAKGGANTMYQAVGRWYLPWRDAGETKGAEPMTLSVTYDRTSLQTEDIVTAKVSLTLHESRPVFQTIVDLGIPPGFEVDASGLEALRKRKLIDKYTLTGRQITLYIQDLQPAKPLTFSYALKARLPVKAKAPKSTAWQYYTPGKRAEAAPVELVVTKR